MRNLPVFVLLFVLLLPVAASATIGQTTVQLALQEERKIEECREMSRDIAQKEIRELRLALMGYCRAQYDYWAGTPYNRMETSQVEGVWQARDNNGGEAGSTPARPSGGTPAGGSGAQTATEAQAKSNKNSIGQDADAYDKGMQGAIGSGTWRQPCQGVTPPNGHFGPRKAGIGRNSHPGWDISTRGGNVPIYPTRPGRVVSYNTTCPSDFPKSASNRYRCCGRCSGFGRVMKVDHGDGYVSTYNHLRRVLVTSGQVDCSKAIAYAGTTGVSSGDHLHWEVFKGNVNLNPEKLVLGREFVNASVANARRGSVSTFVGEMNAASGGRPAAVGSSGYEDFADEYSGEWADGANQFSDMSFMANEATEWYPVEVDDLRQKVPTGQSTVDNSTVRELINQFSQYYGVNAGTMQQLASALSGMKQFDGTGAVLERANDRFGVFQVPWDVAENLNLNPLEVDENIQGGIEYYKTLLAANGGNAQAAINALKSGVMPANANWGSGSMAGVAGLSGLQQQAEALMQKYTSYVAQAQGLQLTIGGLGSGGSALNPTASLLGNNAGLAGVLQNPNQLFETLNRPMSGGEAALRTNLLGQNAASLQALLGQASTQLTATSALRAQLEQAMGSLPTNNPQLKAQLSQYVGVLNQQEGAFAQIQAQLGGAQGGLAQALAGGGQAGGGLAGLQQLMGGAGGGDLNPTAMLNGGVTQQFNAVSGQLNQATQGIASAATQASGTLANTFGSGFASDATQMKGLGLDQVAGTVDGVVQDAHEQRMSDITRYIAMIREKTKKLTEEMFGSENDVAFREQMTQSTDYVTTLGRRNLIVDGSDPMLDMTTGRSVTTSDVWGGN